MQNRTLSIASLPHRILSVRLLAINSLVFSMLILAKPVWAQVGYKLIYYPESLYTTPHGVNNDGDVVGEVIDGNYNQHGFLYKESTHTYSLIDVEDADCTMAFDINDDGTIVGVYVTHDEWGPQSHGFILSGETFTTFTVGMVETWAVGINNNGDVVGWSKDNPEAADVTSFKRTAGGSISSLNYPDSEQTAYRDINDNGTIVGWSDFGIFLLNGSTFSSYTPCSFWAESLKINNNGKIVGVSDHSFTCTATTLTTIVAANQTLNTYTDGINDDDVVVGSSCWYEGCTGFRLPVQPIGMKLTINSFLPFEWIDDPDPSAGSGKILEGDNRTDPDQNGNSRIAVNMSLWNQARVSNQGVFIAGPFVGIALTKEYEKSTSLDMEDHLTWEARSDTEEGSPLMTRTGQAAQPGSPACSGSVMNSPPMGTEGGVELNCAIDIGNGLDYYGWDPNIAFDLDFTFAFTDEDEVLYTIGGCVKYFPSYEIWAGGHLLYATDASQSNPYWIGVPCSIAEHPDVSNSFSLLDN